MHWIAVNCGLSAVRRHHSTVRGPGTRALCQPQCRGLSCWVRRNPGSPPDPSHDSAPYPSCPPPILVQSTDYQPAESRTLHLHSRTPPRSPLTSASRVTRASDDPPQSPSRPSGREFHVPSSDPSCTEKPVSQLPSSIAPTDRKSAHRGFRR